MASSRFSKSTLLALSLVWGSSWIANEMLRAQAGPLHLSLLRYSLAGFFASLVYGGQQLFGWLRFFAPANAMPEAHSLQVNLLLGCTFFAAPDLLLIWSAQNGSAAWTPMIYAAMPLGLLLAAGELRTPAVVGVGAMLVLLNGSLPLTSAKLFWALPIVGAVALQGWSLVYVRRHLATASSMSGVMVQLLTAAVLLRIALVLWPEFSGSWTLLSWPASSLGAVCLLAGIATTTACPLYYRLLRELAPAQLATSEWIQTLVAVGESVALMRQLPGWPMVCAACVMAGCTALLLREGSGEVESSFRLSI